MGGKVWKKKRAKEKKTGKSFRPKREKEEERCGRRIKINGKVNRKIVHVGKGNEGGKVWMKKKEQRKSKLENPSGRKRKRRRKGLEKEERAKEKPER